MKLKINKRIILGISIPLLVIFIVAGLNITYRSGTMHGEKNNKIMPWENHINLEELTTSVISTIQSKVPMPNIPG